MKRVDVLKGVKELVQKAYEQGYISHRADGDWQKTNDGWVRVRSAPNISDLVGEQNQRAEDNPTDREEPSSSGYDEITEEDLVEDDDSELEGYISNKYYNDIANMPVDSNNPDLPDSDALFEIVDGIVEDLDIDDDDEYEKISEMVQDIWSQNNPSDEINKSKIRDMRFNPSVKNMGF